MKKKSVRSCCGKDFYLYDVNINLYSHYNNKRPGHIYTHTHTNAPPPHIYAREADSSGNNNF